MPSRNCEVIRRFVRGPFTITATAYDDEDYDVSELDDDLQQKIEDGDLVVFRVEVVLWLFGTELATEHLGGCVYETPRQFMDHIGLRKAERDHLAQTGHAVRFGSYFHDMVRTVIAEGRKEAIKLMRQMESLRLRGMPANNKDELLRILDRCPDLPDDWDAYNKDAHDAFTRAFEPWAKAAAHVVAKAKGQAKRHSMGTPTA